MWRARGIREAKSGGDVGCGWRRHVLRRSLQANVKGGHVPTKADRLVVEGATTLTIVLTAATGYRGFEQKPDTRRRCERTAMRQLDVALKQSYSALRQRHVADYRPLFDRVSLTLDRNRQHRCRLTSGWRTLPRLPIRRCWRCIFSTGAICYQQFAARHAAGESARHLELPGAAAVEQQLDVEHQCADELLAGGDVQSERLHRAAVGSHRGSQPKPARARRARPMACEAG